MAGERRAAGKRRGDGLRFWLIVAVLCGVAGGSAYQFGKHYLGARMHEMKVKQRAPELVPQPAVSPAAGESEEPPVKPVVIMTEREPTVHEERRAQREIAEPQDGAQLHAARADDRPASPSADEDEEPPAQAPPPPPATDAGEFTVVAGAFADPVNAQRQVERLAERGYHAYTRTVERDGITYRRVHVGSYGSRDEAEEVRDRLRSQGFDATVTGG